MNTMFFDLALNEHLKDLLSMKQVRSCGCINVMNENRAVSSKAVCELSKHTHRCMPETYCMTTTCHRQMV